MFNTRSVTLDGTQKITCPASIPNLDGSAPFTIVGALRSADLSGWGGIVQKCTSADEGFELVNNNTVLRLYMKNVAGSLDTQMSVSVFGVDWAVFACTFDPATKDVHMYANGVEQTPLHTLTSTLTGPLANSALPMVIGEGFKGSINSIQIYQRVLTPTEIALLSTGPTGSTPVDPQTLDTSDDLIAQLDLGPKPDNKHTMHDTAGQYDGVVSGDVTITTDHP